MSNKIKKLFALCAAFALAVGTISVNAANTEVNTNTPGTASDGESSRKGLDPTNKDTYTDTDIDVWAFTKDEIVYSVDVEWGAMTFEYEVSTWDPGQHKKVNTSEGWKIYDAKNDEVITEEKHAINKVTVTNHSNASVYAEFSYTGEEGYKSTTGTFADAEGNENVKGTFNTTTKVLTLETASTDESGQTVTDGTAGTPAKGNVYFMPSGIADSQKVDGAIEGGIAKWTKIGKITVALTTTEPTTTN